MASEKVASVKLSLNAATYVADMKKIGSEGEKSAKQTENAWKKAASAGFGSMKRAGADMATSVKSALRVLGAVGGGLSLAEAVKGAVDLRAQFKGLGYEVKQGTGKTLDWNALMKDAQASAIKWGVATEDLGKAFHTVNEETGSVEFAKAAMDAIAVTARGTGKDVGTLAEIAGKLGEKFDVGGKDIANALAAVVSMSEQGGIHFEDMAGAIDKAGSSAKLLGVLGLGGFQHIIGLANIAKGSAKNLRGALSGVMQIMEEMATPEGAKKIGQAFQVATKDAKGAQKDLFSIMEKIFAKTHGKKELLARGFQGEQLKVVNELGEVYRTTFEKTSGTVQQKTAAALAAYKAHLQDASKAQLDAAGAASDAAERVKGPSAQLQIGMEELKRAFTSPEMMQGLLRLAKVAPEAARRLAHLMEMVFDHPAMAAGIFAGIKLGVPFLTGAFGAGAKAIGASMLEAIVKSGFASSFAGGRNASGQFVGGSALGKGAGALANVAAVAGAGLAGYAAGSAIAEGVIDPMVRANRGQADSLGAATANAPTAATFALNPEAAKSSLDNLRKRIAEAEEARNPSTLGGQLKDFATLGLGHLGTASDNEVAAAKQALATGEAALAKNFGPSATKAGDALDKMADAAGKIVAAANALGAGNAGNGAGSRGPRPVNPVVPGYAPR